MASVATHKDRLAGAALIALGAAMVIVARGFPSIGAVPYGPDLFPTIVGTGLMVSGLGVAIETAPPADESPSRLGHMLGLALLVAFFCLTLDTLGFHIAGGVAFLAAVRLFGGGWVRAVLVAVIGTILLHALFYSAMRVPLPWGLLLPVAW